MSGEEGGGSGRNGGNGSPLARVYPIPDTRARVCVRVISKALAQKFADVLLSDVTHTVQSAALEAGIRPGTVRESLRRWEADECGSLEDEEICEILAKAKEEHIREIRRLGYVCAGRDIRAGTTWMQWQLEVQAPKEHPRKQQIDQTISGPDGGPVGITQSTVQYVVAVPEDEPDDDE